MTDTDFTDPASLPTDLLVEGAAAAKRMLDDLVDAWAALGAVFTDAVIASPTTSLIVRLEDLVAALQLEIGRRIGTPLPGLEEAGR